MDDALLRELIKKGENQFVDFKETLPDSKNLGHTLAGFSTCGGGQLLIGVANQGTMKGLEVDENDFRSKVDNIASLVHPGCDYEIEFKTIDEKKIAVITVFNGYRPIYYFKHEPYVRQGTRSRPATPEEVEKLVIDFYFVQGLQAVKNELRFVEQAVEGQMPIFDLPTDAWRDLLKRASTHEQILIINNLTNIYNTIFTCNNTGICLSHANHLSYKEIQDAISKFCVDRKNHMLIQSLFQFAYENIDRFITVHRGY